jgi:death-on-curing protein
VSDPRWLLRTTIEAIHDAQLAEHGGAVGLRDVHGLESALARPRNLFAYGIGDIFDYATAYASGIVRNHPFVDGNKRTALLAAYVFLRVNGRTLTVSEENAADMTFRLAANEITEDLFAGWLRENCPV